MLNLFILRLERRFDISAIERTALERVSANIVRVGSRTDLIVEGDVPDHVHLIRKGFACRYKVLPNGSRSIVAFLIPGDFCDLNVSILGEMDHCIGTVSPCEVVRIPRRLVEDLTSVYPNLNRVLRWAGLVDESILREWLVSMGRRTADQQVAHLLCEFLVRLQAVELATRDSYHLPLTQIDLGDAMGLSMVHANRVLQKLRADQLIVFKGRHVFIPNVEALMAYSGFNPNYLHLHPKPAPQPYM